MAVLNAFINEELALPRGQYELLQTFTDRGDTVALERRPFKRMVDLWWLSFAFGVRHGLRESGSKMHGFAKGTVLSEDPWRVQYLQLIGLTQLGRESICRPGPVIRMANEFAAGGVTKVVTAIGGNPDAVWSLAKALEALSPAEGDH